MDVTQMNDAQFNELLNADFTELDMMDGDHFGDISAVVVSPSLSSPINGMFSDDTSQGVTSPYSATTSTDDERGNGRRVSKANTITMPVITDHHNNIMYDSSETLNMLNSLYPGVEGQSGLPLLDIDYNNVMPAIPLLQPIPSLPAPLSTPLQRSPAQPSKSKSTTSSQSSSQKTSSKPRNQQPVESSSSDKSSSNSPIILDKTVTTAQKRKKTETKTDEDSDDEHMEEGMTAKVLPWTTFDPHSNYTLCDANMQPVMLSRLSTSGDKGFSFSTVDDAFVCQKKNHFQVSISLQFFGRAVSVVTDTGTRDITRFVVAVKAIKTEMPDKVVAIEQAQTDRSKKPLPPIPLDVIDGRAKLTIPRMHFSETTANNIRRKGKPNPDQRFFYLVVQVFAESHGLIYQIAAERSEPLIVRASNVGLVDGGAGGVGGVGGEVESAWSKGKNGVISHHGNVGINTDNPAEALAVHGNIRVTGTVVHPSDQRIKEDITALDPQQQLNNIRNIKIYNYKLKEHWADTANRSENRDDVGVLAQEVESVMPNAVIHSGDVTMNNGQVVRDLLVVNKDRIYLENVGAVQQLATLTDGLDQRIQELEDINNGLIIAAKLDRNLRHRSNVSFPEKNCAVEEIHESEPFPWLRTLCYIGIALLIASVMAIAVIVGITQTRNNNSSSATLSTTSSPITSSSYNSFFPPVIVALLNVALSIQDYCVGGCAQNQICDLGSCQCLYGISVNGDCLTAPSSYCQRCDQDVSVCQLGGSANFSCFCHNGWHGTLCKQYDPENTYLSSVVLADTDSVGANITMTPAFDLDVNEYIFNITSPIDQNVTSFNLYLSSVKYNSYATWAITQLVFYSCIVAGPGYSPLPYGDSLPFAPVIPISVEPGNLLFIEVTVTAPVTSAMAPPFQVYSFFFTHACNATL